MSPDRAHENQEELDAETPSTPQSIALTFFDPDPGLVFLLEDFKNAYTAYARVSGTKLPSFESVKLAEGHPTGTFDAIVLAIIPGESSTAEALDAARLSALSAIAERGTRLYAIVETDGTDPEAARGTLARLQRTAQTGNMLWGGAVALATGGLSAKFCGWPRMGTLRRPFSEAIDKLVGAARMDCSIKRAQQLGGADVSAFDCDGAVMAKPALPAPLWHLAARRTG